MKNITFKITQFPNPSKILYTVILLFGFHLNVKCNIAKSNPIPQQRAAAFRRAAALNNGVSISWLEQTWNKNALNARPVSQEDFWLLKKLGFHAIRLPVGFEYFEARKIPIERVFKQIDWVLFNCKRLGFKLIIDYHYGKINDQNYTEGTRTAINLWLKIAGHYRHESPDLVFYEIYNEPPHMDPQRWKDAAFNISNAIRKADQTRTLLIGASNYNSIYELSRFIRLADENIIYTFHFYEPFFFTHQGAAWVGDQVATTGVPFPYNGENFPQLSSRAKNTWGETNYYQYRKDGNQQSIKDKLTIVKNWSTRFVVPVLCSEYGVYNKYAALDSRCRYIKAVRQTIRELNIPGVLWDYNTNFSIFTGRPSLAHLPPCMSDALAVN